MTFLSSTASLSLVIRTQASQRLKSGVLPLATCLPVQPASVKLDRRAAAVTAQSFVKYRLILAPFRCIPSRQCFALKTPRKHAGKDCDQLHAAQEGGS